MPTDLALARCALGWSLRTTAANIRRDLSAYGLGNTTFSLVWCWEQPAGSRWNKRPQGATAKVVLDYLRLATSTEPPTATSSTPR